MVFVMCYLLPTGVNMFAYWRSLRALSLHSSWVKRHTTDYNNIIKSERHVTKTLYVAFALYMFSWTPFFLLFILYVLNTSHSNTTFQKLRLAAFMTGNMSSALNPLVYLLRNRLHYRLYSKVSKSLSTLLHHNSTVMRTETLRGDGGSLVTKADERYVDGKPFTT